MRILSNDFLSNFSNDGASHGGTANFAETLGKALNKEKIYWVKVYQEKLGNKIQSENKKKTQNNSWWSLTIPLGYLEKNLFHLKNKTEKETVLKDAILCLKNIMAKEKVDIVFLNGISVFVWCIFKAAKELNIKIVVQHAGVWKFELDNYANNFSPISLELLKEMEKEIAIFSNKNVFLNKTSREIFIRKVIKIPLTKTEIIPLPIKLAYKENKKEEKQETSTKVGMVGRWDKIKNHNAYLQLAKEAQKENLDWKFYSVTHIPQTKKKIKFKKEYRKYVEILPIMPSKKLNKFYNMMDIMILPSLFDVSPHVVVEAAMSETPTYISKGVCYIDMFKKFGANNFIVDFINTKLALNKIKRNIKNKYPPKLIKEFRTIHDIKNVSSKYLKVFNDLMK